MNNTIRIDERSIGRGEPCYIIAEMSANHHQDFHEAVRIIHAIKQAGADAVKLQTYTADTLTISCHNQHFQIGSGSLWEGKYLYDLYKEACTPWEWHFDLKREAEKVGLAFFSSPFDSSAVDFLEQLDVAAYKIASFELVDISLIQRVASTGKPVIMSTGMATIGEIDDAVSAFREAGGHQLALLKCTSAYPSPPEQMNLQTLPHLSAAFQVPAGVSDHTLGIAVPVAAVSLGATIIEKHFTMSRAIAGPDSAFSLEPDEFKEMVDAVRVVEKALGEVSYAPTAAERASMVFRRSLFVVRDIAAGEEFTMDNLRSIRPGNGLPPKYLSEVLGRRASVDLRRGTPLSWSVIR